MKVTIDDPWLGEREVDSTGVGVIRDQLKLLKAFRDDGRKPTEHLLYDIRVYEFIIYASDPEAMAEAYFMKAKELRSIHGALVKKRDIAEALGWKI